MYLVPMLRISGSVPLMRLYAFVVGQKNHFFFTSVILYPHNAGYPYIYMIFYRHAATRQLCHIETLHSPGYPVTVTVFRRPIEKTQSKTACLSLKAIFYIKKCRPSFIIREVLIQNTFVKRKFSFSASAFIHLLRVKTNFLYLCV